MCASQSAGAHWRLVCWPECWSPFTSVPSFLSMYICIHKPSVFVVYKHVIHVIHVVDGVEPYNRFMESLRLITIIGVGV